jgi:hypothetical protein
MKHKSLLAVLLSVAVVMPVVVCAQDDSQRQSEKLRRVQLIMKDGTFQWVLSYKVSGNVVRYRSAERNGAEEDVPLALVDLQATEAWAQQQSAGKEREQRAVLSPELAKEEALRAARTPEIVAGLRLPEEDSVLVLDTYQSGPELVPLAQEGGDLNKETAHTVLKQAIHPSSAAHDILDLRGPSADVQVHTMQPVFYLRVGTEEESDFGSAAITVDTHGASGRATPSGGAASSEYVLEKLLVRNDTREVDSFRIAWLGARKQPDVIELKAEEMAGGKWMKLTSPQPLEVGEYALVEVLSGSEVNLAVWDFGVHPDARANMEAMRPEAQKPVGLERRSRE